MNVDEEMEKRGFRVSASCAGKASYVKWIKYQGKRAYITVTDKSGDGLPGALDEPVKVAICELRSGEEMEPVRDVDSLNAYLETLGE
jgi:hypothetical protein